MADPLIRVEDLTKIYGTDPASALAMVRDGRSKEEIQKRTGLTLGLRDINLDIGGRRICVVMGLSGSGKSTLIRHFNRLIEPTAGRIVVDGTDVMQLSPAELQELRRHRMSMVFQRFGLLPHRTVLQNVGFGLAIQDMPPHQRDETARRWLESVGLAGYEDRYPKQLSGGEQQRVGLARALCTDAEILLMDEAFSALDPLIRNEMQDLLLGLQAKLHKTIVFITHDLDEALRLGDKVAILKDGELVQVGAPTDIVLRPATDYIGAFVKGVNRARALTVSAIMQPPQAAARGNGPTLAAGARLEEVLAETLSAVGPLPVIGDNGELIGQLSRDTLLRVLGAAPDGSEQARSTAAARQRSPGA